MNTCICHGPDGTAVYYCCDECKDASPSCLERIGKKHWTDGMIMQNETGDDFELVTPTATFIDEASDVTDEMFEPAVGIPCPHDPTGKCDGDHAPEGDYSSANDSNND